ncbi:hypothetical protein GCM10011383_44570 [Hymenobacter cavernae]|uniref:Ig-like domain-containing protein n=1 Tax=Hymenobacter cavernae TaxID=2044852 RepID=A0ABQ1UXQ9_9BACT|nr:hypothetical protein GCM10011383_44570 [Hymenobacter cavernae]
MLHEFYTATNGNGWSNHTNWFRLESIADAANWHGVFVTGNANQGYDIRAILLPYNHLTGSLPVSLGLLSGLQDLRLNNNQLAGEMPASIGQLSNLQYLYLHDNQLEGNIPRSFGQLSILQHLVLSSNQLSGELPAELGQLPQLYYLVASFNQLSGPIPAELGGLSHLYAFDVQFNQLSGSIPPELGDLHELTNLSLNNNQLSGSIPAKLGQMSSMQYFYLFENQLTGTIPPELSQMGQVIYIRLSGNQLTGSIPESFGQMPSLRYLYVNNNKLSGLPDWSQTAYKPARIYIEYNALDFTALEPNFSAPGAPVVSILTYLPQTLSSEEVVVAATTGTPLLLASNLGGTYTQYQWQYQQGGSWQNINEATTATYTLADPTALQEGRYRCQATNTRVTGLTLYSKTYRVEINSVAMAPSDPSDDLDRNWTLERTYDGQEHLIGESKQFMDALGRPTQGQVRNLTNQHVLASQTIYSSGGQPVLNTLVAPINNQAFNYKEHFATTNGTEDYGPTNFEDRGLTTAPDAIGDQGTLGSLGYYYGEQNTLEPYTALTYHPYSLTEPYEGPLGGTRRAAGPGEELGMGSGHESRGREVPLLNELDHYLSLRPQFITGSTSTGTLAHQGLKSVSINADGREAISFANKEGQVLATCLSGNEYPGLTLRASINAADPREELPSYQDIHIPAGGATLSFTGAGEVRVRNLLTNVETQVTSISSTATVSPLLEQGFYRVQSVSGSQQFSYVAHYGHFSYSYYDDAGRLIASIAPKGVNLARTAAGTDGPDLQKNWVLNPSFEELVPNSQTPTNWAVEVPNSLHTNSSYAEGWPPAHEGDYHGTHYRNEPYEIYTAQTITGLPDGLYTFRAWTKNQGGQLVTELLAEDYGVSGVGMRTPIPANGGAYEDPWVLVELVNIPVTSGRCKISVHSLAGSEQALYFDDVSFQRQAAQQPVNPNLLANASFENDLTNWQSQGDQYQDYTESFPNAAAGTLHGTHYGPQPYEVYTYQTVTGLANGRYTLRAWVKSKGGQTVAEMLAQNNGGSVQRHVIKQTPGAEGGAWNLIELRDIPVSNGQCEVGFHSKAETATGEWLYFDDVTLVQQVEATTPGTPTGSGELQFVTRNAYNTAGNLLWTANPDEGKTEYVYRRDGNLRFSQSARQQKENKFSYSNYDALGRVVESGEYSTDANGSGPGLVFENHYTTTPATNSVLQSAVLEERTASGGLDDARCSQVNRVWYDLPVDDLPATATSRTQEFVLGAVAKTTTSTSRTAAPAATSWYSYDELGRLVWLLQQTPAIGTKTVDYQYDFTGNVLEVAYQKDQPDAFYHHYQYDADRRLSRVYTSPDGVERTLQARYVYYLHGSLKRVELADRLQGVDYTYTVQGWLKNINHLSGKYDPGQDSPKVNGIAKDLFSLSLDYFTADYHSTSIPVITPILDGNRPVRYDGTVRDAAWRTAASADRHLTAFTYDELGQLKASDYGKLLRGTNQFQPADNQAYSEKNLSYDLNGNLMSLTRRDGVWITDDFSYKYVEGTNKLGQVQNQSGTAVLDYEYDATGQMIRQRDEQGQRYLTYDVTGKVTGVYRDAGHTQPMVTYTYDDRGFRASKASYNTSFALTKTTYYVRDLAGNELSTYEQMPSSAVQRTEVPLYGSGRVGTLTRVDDGTLDARYELNDQLGNARVIFHRPTTTTYTASMEQTQLSADDEQFQNLSSPRVYDTDAWAGRYVTAVEGMTPGPAKQLTVEKGDTITFSAMVKGYAASTPNAAPQMAAFAVAGSSLGATQPVREATTTTTSQTSFSQVLRRVAIGVGITGLFKSRDQQNALAAAVAGGLTAYLHYRFYDKDDNLKAEGDQEMTGTDWQQVVLGFRAPEAGRLELSSGLRAGTQVSFDDVRYEQTGGLIVQEQHQYAYGSPLTGLNYVVGTKRYRHGYQGQFAEKDEETGYESFELRLYDARIGRWLSTDPEGQFDSPFVGMGNNPVSGTDSDGGWSGPGPIDAISSAGLAKGANVTGYSFRKLASRTVSLFNNLERAAGEYAVGFNEGAWSGAKDTGHFLAGLTPWGEDHSWNQLGNGLHSAALITIATPSEKLQLMKSLSGIAVDALTNLPNMNAEEVGYAVGYGTEKLGESIFLSKGGNLAGRFAKNATGFRIIEGGFMTEKPALRVQSHTHAISAIKGRGASGAIRASHTNFNKLHIIHNPKKWKYLSNNPKLPFRYGK